jgi:hypothetical protein
LKVNAENGTKISVYSITGAKVLETKLNGDLNVSSLVSGVYIVAAANGEKAKFIKK